MRDKAEVGVIYRRAGEAHARAIAEHRQAVEVYQHDPTPENLTATWRAYDRTWEAYNKTWPPYYELLNKHSGARRSAKKRDGVVQPRQSVGAYYNSDDAYPPDAPSQSVKE